MSSRLACTFVIALGIGTASCTAVKVQPVPFDALPSSRVCIERNAQVIVPGFLDVVRDGFARHGIATELYDGRPPEACDATVTYTALQSWDLVRYLSHAEIRVWRDGQRVAYAEFHLRGKGGYAMTKYKSTEAKMKPVMDRLLSGWARASAP